MPIVVAHGQPKSGSTFLWATALELSSIANGQEYYSFKDSRLGKDFSGFHANVTADLVESVARQIDPGDYIVLKTHGPFTEEMKDLVESRAVVAFTSFRDPRDTALSTLDAGQSDREKGSSRWFTKFTEVRQLVAPIVRQFNNIVPWVANEQVLSVPYYLIAARQNRVVEVLARHLGYGTLGHRLTQQMDQQKTAVPEWNKGIADRFADELSSEEIRFLNQKFAEILPQYDALLRGKMAELGHRMLCELLVASRERRLERKLSTRAA